MSPTTVAPLLHRHPRPHSLLLHLYTIHSEQHHLLCTTSTLRSPTLHYPQRATPLHHLYTATGNHLSITERNYLHASSSTLPRPSTSTPTTSTPIYQHSHPQPTSSHGRPHDIFRMALPPTIPHQRSHSSSLYPPSLLQACRAQHPLSLWTSATSWAAPSPQLTPLPFYGRQGHTARQHHPPSPGAKRRAALIRAFAAARGA